MNMCGDVKKEKGAAIWKYYFYFLYLHIACLVSLHTILLYGTPVAYFILVSVFGAQPNRIATL